MSFPTETWQRATVDQDDANEAPDPGPSGRATFDIALDDAKAFVSKAGNAVIVLDMRVVGGPLDSYQWAELRGLKTDGQIKAAKATCARLGVDVANVFGIGDIDAQLKGCVGRFYEIEVVQNGEWRNVYVQGPSANTGPGSDVPSDFPTKDEAAAAIASAKADNDDDPVPF